MLVRPDRRKWTRWIDRISNELIRSATDREVYRQWEAIVQANPRLEINNSFMAFIWSNYLDHQVFVVRRQVKKHNQSISLVGLLHEIADYSQHLDRRTFVRNYARPEFTDAVREANRLFDSFAGRGKDLVSSSRTRADADRLVRVSRGLVYLSDKWLAHSDRRRRWPRHGFRQLDRALDALYSTWHRYHVLVRRGPIDADPVSLAGHDWQGVFDVAWRVVVQKRPPRGETKS